MRRQKMKFIENFNLLIYFYLFTYIEIVNDLSYKYMSFNRDDAISNNNSQNEDDYFHSQVNNLKQAYHTHKHYTKVASSSSFTSFEFSDLVDIDEIGAKFKSILCNNDLVDNFNYNDKDELNVSNNEACFITLVPCGDLNDFHLIDIQLKNEYILRNSFNNLEIYF